MQKLIAAQEFYYADLLRKPGDRFTASDDDARLLIGLEKARDASVLQTRHLEAKTDEPFNFGEQKREKRVYRRRDMVAEG